MQVIEAPTKLNFPNEFTCWRSMHYRCDDPKHVSYHRYGGRGITICKEWRASFEQFLTDMGPRPSLNHSIDRIDNEGNYEPGNCRWATRQEQAENRNIPAKPREPWKIVKYDTFSLITCVCGHEWATRSADGAKKCPRCQVKRRAK
jgi:hypothetical protein